MTITPKLHNTYSASEHQALREIASNVGLDILGATLDRRYSDLVAQATAGYDRPIAPITGTIQYCPYTSALIMWDGIRWVEIKKPESNDS